MRLLIGIAVFLTWSAASGYWYACEIKGACAGSETELALDDEVEENDQTEGKTAAIVDLKAEEEEAEIPEAGIEEANTEDDLPEETSAEPVPEEETEAAREAIPAALKAQQTVLFSFAKPIMNDRSDLTDYIVAASDYLRAHSACQLQIVGYTDDTAARENNLELGMRRAEAVADLFREQGVAETQLALRSEGERNPVATNDTRAGRQLNRRAEIQLIYGNEN